MVIGEWKGLKKMKTLEKADRYKEKDLFAKIIKDVFCPKVKNTHVDSKTLF